MKQTLALKLGQQLTMTPQLQQAIRLLQLSSLDLQQEIQTVLESNPMLELNDEEPSSTEDLTGDSLDSAYDTADQTAGDATAESGELPDVNAELDQPMGEDLPVDSNWDDVYTNTSSLPAADSDFDPLANRTEEQSLTDHLLWQLNLTPMAETVKPESCWNAFGRCGRIL